MTRPTGEEPSLNVIGPDLWQMLDGPLIFAKQAGFPGIDEIIEQTLAAFSISAINAEPSLKVEGGLVERVRVLEHALRRIAEGNLGDAPWQASYTKIREVAAEALATGDAVNDGGV